jgi:Na+/melibiose symporter-like transporter
MPEPRRFSFKKYFADCWKNADFRRSAFAFMFSLSAIFVVQDIIQYYVNYWLRSPELFLPLAGSVLVLGFLSVPLWVLICNRIGKRNGLFLGAACWVAALLTLAFLPQQPYAEVALSFQNEVYVVPLTMSEAIAAFPVWGWAAVIVLGFGMGNIHLTAYGMYPDAISVATAGHPELEGSHFGAVSFLQKVGIGVATLVIGPILDLTGYIAGPGTAWTSALADAGLAVDKTWLYIQPAAEAPEAIKWIFVTLPIALILMAALSVRRYHVDSLLNK